MTPRSSTSSSEPHTGLPRLGRRLLLFLPVAGLVLAVNARVDPGNVLGSGEWERHMAGELLDGRSVQLPAAYDEMLLQRRYVEGSRRRPDVLVLGSSRTMPVASSSFPGRRVWNGSVSSASLEDLIAVEQTFEDRGLRPDSVLLGLDPWVLAATLRNPSVALDGELQRASRRLGLGLDSTRGALPPARSASVRYLELLSPAYFQASLSMLAAGGLGVRGSRSATAEKGSPPVSDPEGNLRHPDGSVEWGPRLANRSPEEVRILARLHAARPPQYLLAGALRPERQRLLEAFLARLEADGVTVTLYLPPFHPEAYGPLRREERTASIVDSEVYFRSLAVARGLEVWSSFDPVRAGARESDFVDQHHPRREATARLLEAAASPARAGVGGPRRD